MVVTLQVKPAEKSLMHDETLLYSRPFKGLKRFLFSCIRALGIPKGDACQGRKKWTNDIMSSRMPDDLTRNDLHFVWTLEDEGAVAQAESHSNLCRIYVEPTSGTIERGRDDREGRGRSR